MAFEFRHSNWFTDETYALLRKRKAALCVAESDELKTPDVATAAFQYFRLRQDGGYSATKLKAMAATFAKKPTGDVYVYFKHEDEPTGALNAVAFRKHLAKMAGGAA